MNSRFLAAVLTESMPGTTGACSQSASPGPLAPNRTPPVCPRPIKAVRVGVTRQYLTRTHQSGPWHSPDRRHASVCRDAKDVALAREPDDLRDTIFALR